ncbi:MAG: DUF1376 domain-containing protein [Thermoleophilia bacterium]
MAEFPFFRFFVGDYQSDTDHLSTEEHGAYLLLLMHYWRKGFLKKDPSKLKNICKLSRFKFNKYFPTLMEFFEESDGFLINKRMEKELQYAGKKSEHARRAAQAKWDAVADAGAMPEHMPELCPDDAMSEVRGHKDLTPLPPQVGELEIKEEKPTRRLRSAGTSLRQTGDAPRQISGKEKYEAEKQAAIDRRKTQEAEEARIESEKLSHEENLEAIRAIKNRKQQQTDEVVI